MSTTVYIPTATLAAKADRLLTRKNIKSKLTKTVSHTDGGCVYALEIFEDDIYGAVYELKMGGIPYRISEK